MSAYPTDTSGIGYYNFPTLNASFQGYGKSSMTVGASAYTCPGPSYYLRDNTANITSSTNPTVAVLEGGVNDEICACARPCTAAPSADFSAAYLAMLRNMAGNMSAGGILIARGILPYGGSTNNASTIAAWRAAQAAAVAAYNASPTSGVQAFYVDPTGWVSTTTDLVGSLHPNDTGYAKVRLQMIPIEQAAISIHSTAWF